MEWGAAGGTIRDNVCRIFITFFVSTAIWGASAPPAVVTDVPQVRLDLPDQEVACGLPVVFTALGAEGQLLEGAQWRVNGRVVPTRGARLTLGSATEALDGTVVDFQAGPASSRTALLTVTGPGGHASRRWATAVAGLLQAPRARAVRGGTLFCGSSTVALWDLKAAFPGRGFANRGFGGSTFADLLHHSGELMVKPAPGRLVLYAGDNDLALGQEPETVLETARRLKLRLRGCLPGVRLVLLGIKPSPARQALWPVAQQVNAELKALFTGPDLAFLDPADALCDPAGAPDSACYRADGLHLNAQGYARLTALLAAALR